MFDDIPVAHEHRRKNLQQCTRAPMIWVSNRISQHIDAVVVNFAYNLDPNVPAGGCTASPNPPSLLTSIQWPLYNSTFNGTLLVFEEGNVLNITRGCVWATSRSSLAFEPSFPRWARLASVKPDFTDLVTTATRPLDASFFAFDAA